MVWVQPVHDLHCPSCDDRLMEQVGRFALPHRPGLPSRQERYAYRDQLGLPATPR